ncbi:helix-turn-helix domain-containing protein [Caulobacter sp. 17J65-9]|uniref:helix-turn-helix transcriptional regulator n=1 Tax=Caulobacter sp. 17J65-9 TaxID=2709382 RepID=UPI001F08C134|nr:helix-turn-helix domain-containing protein [Caulobacter sp. 17J65-9]
MAGGVATLAHGVFYGAADLERTAGAFRVTDREATVPAHEIEHHVHSDAHFIFVTRGRYLSTADGADDAPASPLVIYNPPGTAHRDCFGPGLGRFLAVSMPAETLGALDWADRAPRSAVRLRRPDAYAGVWRLLRAVRHEPTTETLESLCLELVGAATDERAAASAPSWLARARELLTEAPPAGGVAAVAAEVGVHPVYLARAFRRHLACTPAEYARRRRVERAADLLARTRTPLGQIAADTGFCDQSHLTHAFQAVFGATPGEYRRVLNPSGSMLTRPARR